MDDHHFSYIVIFWYKNAGYSPKHAVNTHLSNKYPTYKYV
jgi:hypothetical protein